MTLCLDSKLCDVHVTVSLVTSQRPPVFSVCVQASRSPYVWPSRTTGLVQNARHARSRCAAVSMRMPPKSIQELTR